MVVTCPWVIVDHREKCPLCYVFPKKDFIDIVAKIHLDYEKMRSKKTGDEAYIDKRVELIFDKLDAKIKEKYKEKWKNIWEKS